MLLSEILAPDRIRVPIRAGDKAGVIAELTGLLVDRAGGVYQDVLAAILEREAVLSTGIGHGVALPHGRSPSLRELCIVGGTTAYPVPFDAIDGEPVRVCFVVAGPESAAGQHVKVLSRIARLVRREPVRAALIGATTPREFYDAIVAAEEQ
ncbi:MAG: PTS sugar transporter subunit IIA [Gemmatimonadota bacterium]